VVTAWTVPVVQAVSAVPAFACSGTAVLSVAPVTGTAVAITRRNDGTADFRVDVTITNTGGSATNGLVATLDWQPKGGDEKKGALGKIDPPTAPWTAGTTSWTTAAQIKPQANQQFTLTGKLIQGKGNIMGTLQVTFAASSCETATVSGSI
jgi:hypothetical protein